MLYNITSKDSFDSVISCYNKLKNNTRYNNVKYIIVGNKIDLIEEDDDDQSSKNGDKNYKEEKEEKEEKKENIDKNNPLEDVDKDKNENNKNKNTNNSSDNNNENTINNKNCFNEIIEKENFDLKKEISGLSGFNLEALLDETVSLLYRAVKELENVRNEQYQIESDSLFVNNKMEMDNRQSYYDIEYKNEVTKINKQNINFCCLSCNIV